MRFRYFISALLFALALSAAADAAKIVQPGAGLTSVAVDGVTIQGNGTGGNALSVKNISPTNFPTVQMIGTPTNNAAAAGTSVSINTVTGISAGDNLYMCVNVTSKPTTIISCPAGWSTLVTAGNLTDGAQQPQVALCGRTATGSDSASYSPSWTGSSFNDAYEVAIRGLTQNATTNDFTASAQTTTTQQFLSTQPSTNAMNEFVIGCVTEGSASARGQLNLGNIGPYPATSNIQGFMGVGMNTGLQLSINNPSGGVILSLAGVWTH